jgi:hypothetical protein
LHAVGPEVLAWLGWLVALPCSIATKAAGMDASAWAAWVQAVFSLAAIGVVIRQNYLEKKRRERDRDDRATVVAARLSIWLVEIGALIEIRLDQLDKEIAGIRRRYSTLSKYKLSVSGEIDSVMSDLHYLRKGSADVAQLDAFSKEYDMLIDKAVINETQDGVHGELARHLENMKKLHANAARLLGPLVSDAVDNER